MTTQYDPITLEILWRRLISIVDEADVSVARTAFSSLLRDAHDYTCVFTDRQGRLLAQGTFCTPGQAGALLLGIKKWIGRLPQETYQPGDVFITNDPWLLAGHLNDVCVMAPIFYHGNVIAFTACVFHHADIGGRVASDNHDVYEDGLFIPSLKLYDAGVLNEAILSMIRWNVRRPEDCIGDLRSQVAANHICAQRIVEMMDELGMENLDGLAQQIMDLTEHSMRQAIGEIPAGTYTHEGRIESPGGRGEIQIKAVVNVKGSDIVVDLDGSAEVNWGGNVVYNFTYAYVFMAIKSAFNPEIPNNEGCARPITLHASEGTVIHCRYPVAVAARMQIGHFLTEILFRALAPAIPSRIIAGSGGTPAWMQVVYGKRHDGRKFSNVLIRGGGMGASDRQDGRSMVIFPANGANTPVEIFESDTPLLIEKKELLTDSGGAGKMRGGLGQQLIFKVPDDQYAPSSPTSIGLQGGRFRYPAEGVFGGQPGSTSRFAIDGLPADPGTLNFAKPGQTIVFFNPGGGGYGNPLERDPQAVAKDVADEYVSLEKAREDYGVIIDAQTRELDFEATEKLRKSRSTKSEERRAHPAVGGGG